MERVEGVKLLPPSMRGVYIGMLSVVLEQFGSHDFSPVSDES